MKALISAFDIRVLEALFNERDPLLVEFFVVLTQFGNSWLVAGLTISIALLLLLRRQYAAAAGLALSVGTTGIIILLLKGLVARARPPVQFQTYAEIWFSFPSAHAALAAALFGFLAYLAWYFISKSFWRYLFVAVCLLLPCLIAFSRVYLGVHYPSDVFAGMLVGAACACLGIWYARFVHNA